MSVIEDVDRFKKDVTETGRNARRTIRYLDELRKKGSLSHGVALDNGGRLYVRTDAHKGQQKVAGVLHESTRDSYLLALALTVREESAEPTILVTKDVNLRIKADALGLPVEDYESDKVDIEELYSGYREVSVDPSVLSLFSQKSFIPIEGDFLPNQYLILHDVNTAGNTAFARYDAAAGTAVRLMQAGGGRDVRIEPRNREQAFAIDALLNDAIQLVSLVGMAGTGKTLLAVAVGLYKTVDENVYSRMLVSRPTLPMGKDIGFLPGTVEEKLAPWMYPIIDNVELLMRQEKGARRPVRGFKELVELGILVVEPLTYIRGRSIHNQFLIVDEAQNLTPHEIKTIITRVGDGTKIVLTGDPYQIDNPYIDSASNGLTYVAEKFKSQSVAAHVTLKKGERSVLSELAAQLL